MDKLKRLLKKTPPVPLGIAGALLFLLLFYTLAFRTPLWQVWMPPNIDNDEVIYNRQVVSVIAHGGPLGYFGYNEGTADIGRYGAWGPVLIWVYGLAGRLFGASVNTMFWCNVLFLALGVVVFTIAARLNIDQQILCYGGLVCLWMPLAGSFCGSSEALHYMLALVIAGSTAALLRGGSHWWLVPAALACGLETIFRPYALLFWAFPLVAVWADKKRRNFCLGEAIFSFCVALFSMTKLSASYFSGGGMDFGGLELLAHGKIGEAIVYEMNHAAKELVTVGQDIPRTFVEKTYFGRGCIIFLMILAVTLVCFVLDRRAHRPSPLKACALGCTGIIALVLVFLYNIAPRHLMLLSILLLASVVVEDAARGLVWLPVLAVVLLPINAERSTLSTYFDEMGSQITAVETALQERMDARASADPWDNTLAYAYADDVFHGYLYALPAGMGIEFDMNTYIADPEKTIYSRYAMVNHGTDAEARLLEDGWQEVISTEDLIVYERPDTQ